MIDQKSVLAVIPARGGSKGFPGKNIYSLGGKPLIAWTIEEALQSNYIDRLILSSDDDSIIQVAKQYGCDIPFIRPTKLALDDTPSVDVVLHALEEISGYDYVVLLQPTSPLRRAEDIDGCIRMCMELGAPSVVSLSEVAENPYWMFKLKNSYTLEPLMNGIGGLRRQDLPQIYSLNGAVYVSTTESIKKTKALITDNTLGYTMPIERSIDIDSAIDIKIAEYYLNQIYSL